MPHRKTKGIAANYKAVHAPVVDLRLFLIEPVDEIGGRHRGRHEATDIEGRVGQVEREGGVRGLREGAVPNSTLVHLRRTAPGIAKAIGALEFTVQIVEAAIFEVNDDHMIDGSQLAHRSGSRSGATHLAPRKENEGQGEPLEASNYSLTSRDSWNGSGSKSIGH
jgi:hypothetical protein